MKLTQTCVLAVPALVVVAACEPLSGVAALELAPSPAAQVLTAAAVSGAPPADVQRASTALAKNIAEWDRPQRAGKRPPAPQVDAGVLATTTNPRGFATAVAALDSVLHGASVPPQQRGTP
jgi:hypothetical protein